ncbi:tetratricopeptide repeat protein [Corallincola luteus]|uniref:Tetratricopeptide repeat protein n=1 Tax=Corallincola luteus TaxID=1775177 RepID=A0ABY2AFH8_9GAMM|nr:J domain-containing protein [Corallincola luteus]TCI01179.1 tetratricopeptide repeat protein [Corallincola luteus]
MSCWEVLGIAPTSDKRTIQLAYTTLLKQCNPEDKPEQFKQLRKAYESAKKEAKRQKKSAGSASDNNEDALTFTPQPPASPALDNSAQEPQPFASESDEEEFEDPSRSDPVAPVAVEISEPITAARGKAKTIEQLRYSLLQLYSDVAERGNPEAWKQLLDSPVYWDLDQSSAVMLCTLEFLSEHLLLPPEVLSYLDNALKLSAEQSNSLNETIRGLAEAISRHCATRLQRIPYEFKFDETQAIEPLLQHLELRHTIEELCIFGRPSQDKLQSLLSQIQPAFAEDISLFTYVARTALRCGLFQMAWHCLSSVEPLIAVDQTEFTQRHGPVIRELQVRVLYGLKDFAAAAKLITEWAVDSREEPSLIKLHAQCLIQLEQLPSAIGLLEQVIKQVPQDIEARALLASAWRKQLEHLKHRLSQPHNEDILERQLASKRYAEILQVIRLYPHAYGDRKEQARGECLRAMDLDYFWDEWQQRLEDGKKVWPVIADVIVYALDKVDDETFVEYIWPNVQQELDLEQNDLYGLQSYAQALAYLRAIDLDAIELNEEQRHSVRHAALNSLISALQFDNTCPDKRNASELGMRLANEFRLTMEFYDGHFLDFCFNLEALAPERVLYQAKADALELRNEFQAAAEAYLQAVRFQHEEASQHIEWLEKARACCDNIESPESSLTELQSAITQQLEALQDPLVVGGHNE